MAAIVMGVIQGCSSPPVLDLAQPTFKGNAAPKRSVKLYVIAIADKKNILLPTRNFIYPHWDKSRRILSADSDILSEHKYHMLNASFLPEKDGLVYFKFTPNRHYNQKTKQYSTNKVEIERIEIRGGDFPKENQRKSKSNKKCKQYFKDGKLIVTDIDSESISFENQFVAARIKVKKLQKIYISVKVKAVRDSHTSKLKNVSKS